MSADTSNVLGIKNVTDEQYETIAKYKDHTYTIAPPSGFISHASQQYVERLLGGKLDPTMTVDQLERIRERIQVCDKREQQKIYHHLSNVWMQRLSVGFRKEQKVNHAEIEKMFYPTYAPKYADAVHALDLPLKKWWKQESFASLEHIARLPLDRADLHTGRIRMTFEEWYHLHWNFYMPFSPAQFTCAVTSESCIWTEEFVTELASYCRDRIETQYSSQNKVPILMLGNSVGKLAYLLNQTKLLRGIPVVAAHEKPNTNPYILKIPPQKQKEFAVRPVQTMTDADALEKYQPAIVLLPNMKANVDVTATVRRFGCVKEYLTIGVADSYSEGHGWDTFGFPRYRDSKDESTVPPFMIDRFKRRNLKHISRWLLHKHDSQEVFGLASVQSFVREKYVWSRPQKMEMFLKRFRPRFF